MGERWVGTRGHPTTLNGAPVRVGTEDIELSHTIVHAGDPTMFRHGHAAGFTRLAEAVSAVVYGGDFYNYALLSSGHVRICPDARL